MPEMPEVEGLRCYLSASLVGRTVTRTELAAFSALKTFATPLSALLGGEVDRVDRRGKFLCLGIDGLWLVVHLARAGWLRWYDAAPPRPARPGKGPLAFRLVAEGPPAHAPGESAPGPVGFDLTEAGTQKHLALYVVGDLAEVPGIARLGLDPLADDGTVADFAAVLAEHPRTQLKGLLRDQRVFAGIGNAYSDEILQAAGLSPFKLAGTLDVGQTATLYTATRACLTEAITRAVGLPPAKLKDNKRSHLGIHGQKGEPCPTCGTPVAEVSFADSFLNYCPTCQTGGTLLADRRMSKLLK
ncbi:MAG: DNA-formamidopyrimidine glycosylase family protein [Propioniciclava sp.]